MVDQAIGGRRDEFVPLIRGKEGVKQMSLFSTSTVRIPDDR